MTLTSFPSAEFPGFPSIALDRPEGWQARAASDTVLAVVEDRDDDTFSPNVVATVTRIAAPYTLDDAATAADVYIGGLVEVEQIDSARVQLNGRAWAVTEFAHIAEGAGTLVQVLAVTVVENGPFADVVRLTGSVSPVGFETTLPQVRAIITSAVVETR